MFRSLTQKIFDEYGGFCRAYIWYGLFWSVAALMAWCAPGGPRRGRARRWCRASGAALRRRLDLGTAQFGNGLAYNWLTLRSVPLRGCGRGVAATVDALASWP